MNTRTVHRNPFVLAARMRNSGGPMKDRRTPRGGARNHQADLLAEFEDSLAGQIDHADQEDE